MKAAASRWAVGAVLLTGLVATATPTGSKWLVTPTYHVFNHSSINGVSGFSTNVLPRVQNAFLTWTKTKVSCTSYDVQNGTSFSTPTGIAAVSASDHQNNVLWLGGNSWRYGAATLGLTGTSYNATNGEILDADMELNDNINWSSTGAANTYDFESVVLHEAGHFLGLGHTPNDASAVMYPSVAAGDIKRTLAQADITDVCTVYPGNGVPGSQGSTCLQTSNCATTGGLSCLGAVGSTSKICTVACSGATCPSGYVCQQTSAGGQACLFPIGAPDLCKFCTNGSDCSTGNCVSDGPHNWCTTSCTSNASCGNGYTCVQNGSSGNVCVPSGVCSAQCTTSGQCPLGYGCTNGACEATGNLGDHCEVSTYCKPCGLCIGTSTAAYCRSCCGGQGSGGACTSCAAASCGAGASCQGLTSSNDKVCVPTTASTCQACNANTPCASGLSCVGGKCHASCNPAAPGACQACYDAGTGTHICACSSEIAATGQPCGAGPDGTFLACINSQICVAETGAASTCHRICALGASGTCGAGALCQQVQGHAVCVAQTTPGNACSTCTNGACSAGLRCVGGRCYAACDPSAPSCTSCVADSASTGVCACSDQLAGANQTCGYLSDTDLYSCQAGLTCINRNCREECNPAASGTCQAGTECQVLNATPFCLPPGTVGGVDGGTPSVDAGFSADAGAEKPAPTASGCGCQGGGGNLGMYGLGAGLGACVLCRRRRVALRP